MITVKRGLVKALRSPYRLLTTPIVGEAMIVVFAGEINFTYFFRTTASRATIAAYGSALSFAAALAQKLETYRDCDLLAFSSDGFECPLP